MKGPSILEISAENFTDYFDDLAGVRILHIFKGDWEGIHDSINDTWPVKECFAYVRSGDQGEQLAAFERKNCEVRTHPDNYRSVHYVVEVAPTRVKTRVELQVRSVFEEGWSEIDHAVRYPRLSDDPLLRKFLEDFNALSGLADSMGDFVLKLRHQGVAGRGLAGQARSQRGILQMLSLELQKAMDLLANSKSKKDRQSVMSTLDLLRMLIQQLGVSEAPGEKFFSTAPATDASAAAVHQ